MVDITSKLSDAKTAASSATKSVQAGSTLMTTKAKDALMTVDGYGKTAKDTLTGMSNTIQNKIAAAKNFLFNTKIGDLGSLNDALATAKEVREDVTALTTQLNSALDGTIGTVKGMSSDLQSQIQGQLNNLNKLPFDQVQNGNSFLKVALGATVPEINNLIETSNRLLDLPGEEFGRIKDSASDYAMRVSILTNAARLGMTNIIDRVMSTNPNDVVMKTALIDQFDFAVQNGDVTILNSMLDHLGVDFVLQRYPTAVADIISYYRLPVGALAADYSNYKNELVAILTRFNANWDRLSFKATNPRNLSVFNGASNDVKKLMITDTLYNRMLTVSGHFTATTSLKSLAKQMYPYAAIA
ncbi:hypothetical protein [Erwinia phage vB_Ea277G]|nr:hypothetical protein [Erwinia phage vB_Ea277G]